MLCYVQPVSPDFGPMQGTRSQSVSGLRSDAGGKAPVSPDFGPMQGTRSQSVSGLRSDAGGKAPVSPDFGPMQGTRSQSVSGLRSDAGGKALVSPDFGPMQGTRSQSFFGLRSDVGGKAQLVRTLVRCSGQGPVCALYVFAWYPVFKRGAWGDCSAHTVSVSLGMFDSDNDIML
ncbi:unnamed protein product [Lactuca saligna]|uniref:Uncharacterized protein n=1 Tax=Lactuca saligna TaxID=75948 RepID=A0AA35VTJ0_LACSI|nr:unnamed protein product [Lactuca saligna]